MDDKAKTSSVSSTIIGVKGTLIQPGFLTISFSLNR